MLNYIRYITGTFPCSSYARLHSLCRGLVLQQWLMGKAANSPVCLVVAVQLVMENRECQSAEQTGTAPV